jgi:BASS family bile acid:Na+ symporter
VATEHLISLLVTITLIEMMISIGISVTFTDLALVARNRRLLIHGALSSYVCVPVATVFLSHLLDADPLVAAGFLIMAVCPGAPYGPPLTAIAQGNVPAAVGLMVLLAGSSAIIAPIALRGLLPLISGNEPFLIDTGRIVVTLLFTQMLPLCLGIALRRWWPTTANKIQQPARLLSKVLNLLTVGLILITHFALLAEIRPRGLFGMVILLIVSWTAGWLIGRPITDTRKALAVTTSLRNFGVGLVIATSTFAGTPAVTAIVAYGLVSLLGTLALAMLAGTFTSRQMVRQ